MQPRSVQRAERLPWLFHLGKLFVVVILCLVQIAVIDWLSSMQVKFGFGLGLVCFSTNLHVFRCAGHAPLACRRTSFSTELTCRL